MSRKPPGALKRRVDAASGREGRGPRRPTGRDGRAELSGPRTGQLTLQIEEAYKDPGATKRNALPERRGPHRGDVQAPQDGGRRTPAPRPPAETGRLVATPGALRLLEAAHS
jgi:hypothetical protein